MAKGACANGVAACEDGGSGGAVGERGGQVELSEFVLLFVCAFVDVEIGALPDAILAAEAAVLHD